MPTPTVSIAIDTPQPRIVGDRLAKVFAARDFDLTASSAGVGVEFVADTGILTPLPYTAEWLTTTSGNYARLRKAQLSIASSSAWVEYQRGYSGNWYQHSLDNNDIVRTLQAYERNRPVWLSWFAYNLGNEVQVMLRCGWGEGTEAEVSLEFYSDGNVLIYKNGEQVGTANIANKVFYANGQDLKQTRKGASSRMLANETVDIVLIPGRRRELLCLANTGGGFNYFFEDLDPEDDSPTVTGPGPFWFQVPTGQATVQLAPLKFAASGYLLSPAFRLREAPNAGEISSDIVTYDLAGYGTQGVEVSLVETNGTTLFVADGDLQEGRLRVDLTGDGDSTPFVYGCSSAFAALTAELDGAYTFLDRIEGERGWWTAFELDVPDDSEGVTARVHIADPAGLEARGATDIRSTGNRDIEAAIGEIRFFIGRTLDPEYEADGREEAEQMLIECRDRALLHEKYQIQDPEPIGGLNFSHAIRYFATLPGFTDADMDIGAIDYRLPSLEQNSDGKFALLPEVGDRPSEWIRRLWEEFAQKCLRGWVPTADGMVYRFKTPEQLGNESHVTLYVSNEAAVADGRPEGDNKRWIYGWKPRTLIPEANDIYVVGKDVRRNLPIIAHYRDRESVDPTLLPEDRPDNWVGEIRQYSYVDPWLISEADTAWVLGNFVEVLPRKRRIAEFRSQFLLKADGAPLWKGDCLTIKGCRDSRLDGKWRIKTLSALFDLEKANADDITTLDNIWRETTYVAERERIQD